MRAANLGLRSRFWGIAMQMDQKLKLALAATVVALALSPARAPANGILVTNLMLVNTRPSSGTVDIQFDLGWSNSWRAEWMDGAAVISNWDAAWVFAKYRLDGGEWQHARLASSGHRPAPGCVIQTGASGDGTNVGAFIYRSAVGHGDLSAPETRLTWQYTENGLDRTSRMDICVMAIEMVCVAEGPFQLGDGNTSDCRFEDAASGTPFTLSAESIEITLGGGGAGSLGNNRPTGSDQYGTADDFSDSVSKTLPAEFPKGYAAFYCMKHEITQGQYAEFLNTLTRDQQAARCNPTTVGYYMSDAAGGSAAVQYRNTVQLSADPGNPAPRVYATATPDRACNFLSFKDVAAYAAWAGLRPMTELEYEKACRGLASPVTDEYAWGDGFLVSTAAADVLYDGTGEDIVTNGNCNASGTGGPLRVGIFATGSSARWVAGSSYWGIMELAGNVSEQVIRVGTSNGRLFTGLHGTGSLTAAGAAPLSSWVAANSSGHHGGNFEQSAFKISSRRRVGSSTTDDRFRFIVGLCARTLP